MALLSANTASAGQLFKCVDTNGHVSYQDVNCGPAQTRHRIKGVSANWLPMHISPGDARLLTQYEAAQRRAGLARRKRYNQMLKRWKQKAQRCKLLKARYYKVEDSLQLHNGTDYLDKASALLDRMRKACSD